MALRYASNGLEEPFPSCLGGPESRFGFYCWRDDGNFCFHNFHATFAAKRFLDMIIQGHKFKWLDSKTILTDHGYKIKAEWHCSLEDVIEYNYKGKEAEYEFPIPYSRIFAAFSRTAPVDGHISAPTEDDTPRKSRTPSEPRPDGLISLASIAEGLNIDPRDARQALRKSNTEKPAHGWHFTPADVDKIKRILKGK